MVYYKIENRKIQTLEHPQIEKYSSRNLKYFYVLKFAQTFKWGFGTLCSQPDTIPSFTIWGLEMSEKYLLTPVDFAYDSNFNSAITKITLF